MDFAREQPRMLKMMDLDRSMLGSMARAMPGVCTRSDVDVMIQTRDGYQELYAGSLPSDGLVTMDTLDQKIADVTEWIARGLDSIRDSTQALAYFQEARQLYAARNDAVAVARIDDRIGDIRVQSEGALDEELARVRRQLESNGLDPLVRAKALVILGELLSKAGDDFEAEKALLEAETLLAATPNLNRDQILRSLATSLEALGGGAAASGGKLPIEKAMETRGIYQRLYFAFGNVYRDTNPAKAQEYEAKLAAFDPPGKVDAQVVAQLLEQFKQFAG